ncbi:MAG: hypothetical protein A2161_12145 [Candidatus Schekmanbacteria bacterium RBG_13_48_7]|uniref:ABC transporter substrate-binding protein n=1 Tax=Candidatus Schekmanbacteria bacterium RBG_13_48_7 TaxID=1817878 RepID=A0A1F7RV13_9BACT|nr:MAG: hypothetical protein A2161_12145 [Candidatus Schekmanbacteria bacterium RBG_13_48_7]
MVKLDSAIWKFLISCILTLVFILTPCCSDVSRNVQESKKIEVFVSILPLKTFVDRVGGKYINVSVMVGQGQSPATYEPYPKQLIALSESKLYFRIGVPFEKAWISKIQQANLSMKIIDVCNGINLRDMESHLLSDPESSEGHVHPPGDKDPHTWLSPPLVKIMAKNIADAFSRLDAEHKTYYEKNLESFTNELDNLDREIKDIFKNIKQRKFLVFHPSWGYFAEEYGLKQIPIEVEGKEASGKELVEIIELAKKENFKIIFVQKQFSKKQAQTVAHAIGGEVIPVDPLAADYFDNLLNTAKTFVKVL